MKILSLCVCILICSGVFSMEPREVIRKMQQVYKDLTSYEYTCRYELFKGHKSTEVADAYDGKFCRSKAGYYQQIGQAEFVYAESFFLKVNHSEKAVALNLPQKNVQQQADLEQALKHCSEIKLEDNDTYYTVILKISNTSLVPYSLIRVRISKSDYHLLRLDLYYTDMKDFSSVRNKPDMEQPHLRITFGELNKKPKSTNHLFSQSTYLKTVNNMLIPTGRCEGYSLIDKRI